MSNIIFLEETNSTNEYLYKQSKLTDLEEGSMLASKYQTHGRGQANNLWEAEKGKNILCSMILYPDFIPIEKQFILSEITSLAILDTLKTYENSLNIKWPNDIYYQNKKIAGILIENFISSKKIEKSILGIGININQENFSPHLPNPISLKKIIKKDLDIKPLIQNLQNNLLYRYYKLLHNKYEETHKEYLNKLFRFNENAFYQEKNIVFEATIKNVELNGRLVLEIKETKEIKKYLFKEVEFIL